LSRVSNGDAETRKEGQRRREMEAMERIASAIEVSRRVSDFRSFSSPCLSCRLRRGGEAKPSEGKRMKQIQGNVAKEGGLWNGVDRRYTKGDKDSRFQSSATGGRCSGILRSVQSGGCWRWEMQYDRVRDGRPHTDKLMLWWWCEKQEPEQSPNPNPVHAIHSIPRDVRVQP
jgi:hypothetical protein